MTAPELVARGIDAHNGGNYPKAISLLLMALLIIQRPPGDKYDMEAVRGNDLVAPKV